MSTHAPPQRVPRPAYAAPPQRARAASPASSGGLGERARALNGSPRVARQAELAAVLSRAPAVAGEAPVQRVPWAGTFGWGLWARGGGKAGSDANVAAIQDALGRYHRGRDQFAGDQAFADHRARALDDAQSGVNRYVGALGDLSQGSLARDYMLDLMDQLQEAHVEHTDYVHRNDLELYSATPLGRRGRREMNRAWNQVRHGDRAVHLPAGAANEADNRRTRASFARLLSHPGGRRLVQGLVDQTQGAWTVNVRYRDRLTDAERTRRERNRGDLERIEAAMAAGVATPAMLQERLVLTDETLPNYRSTDAEEPARASQQVGNRGANLRVLRGLADSENLNHRGVRTSLIAAPAHIVLGHELIHALHYKRNQNAPGNPALYGPGTALNHWGNAEEHRTIAQGPGVTENDLRAEHGLPAREGHTGPHRRTLPRADTRLRRQGGTLALAGLGAAAYYNRRWLGSLAGLE